MASKHIVHRDVWGHEREGYCEHRPQIAYAPTQRVPGISASTWCHWEERLGSLGAGLGVIWGVHVAATHPAILDALWETSGPLELCAISTLIWLHAKWRRTTHLR